MSYWQKIEKACVETVDDMLGVMERLGKTEILAQLGEESAELAQSALKLRRVLDGKNFTPVTEADAWESLQEEFADVFLCMTLIGISEERVAATIRRKAPRWRKRLNKQQKDAG